jgi:hypothetical protein
MDRYRLEAIDLERRGRDEAMNQRAEVRTLLETFERLLLVLEQRLLAGDGAVLQDIRRERQRLRAMLDAESREETGTTETVRLCSGCRGILDENDCCQSIGKFLEKRLSKRIVFTHGLCRECACLLYPQYAAKMYPAPADE